MTSVFIDVSLGSEQSSFFLPHCFSVRAAVAKKMAAKRYALLYLFTTEICEISLACLYKAVSML